MPQLQYLGSLGEMIHRGHVSRIELLPQPICLVCIVRQFFLGEVVQVQAQDLHSPLLIGHGHQLFQKAFGHHRELLGGKQAAVSGQALCNDLCGGFPQGCVSGAQIFHL